MTAKPSSIPCRPTAPGRSFRITLSALVLSAAIVLGGGASASLASTGSVYFDNDENAAAGRTLFNGSFTGFGNVGLGRTVMPELTSGGNNVAVGRNALHDVTFGVANVATGSQALYSNSVGGGNVATGTSALEFNWAGGSNVATGIGALRFNTQGNLNVASGASALQSNTFGDGNVASGPSALWRNRRGSLNTALGNGALGGNTHGDRNLALGAGAGGSLTTGNNNVAIANPGVAAESGAIRIGTAGEQTSAFIQGIDGTTIPGPTRVVRINSDGRLGTATVARGDGRAAQRRRRPGLLDLVKRQQRQIERLRAGRGRLIEAREDTLEPRSRGHRLRPRRVPSNARWNTQPRPLGLAQATKGRGHMAQPQFPSLPANRASAPVPHHGGRAGAQRAARPRRGLD